MCLALKGKGISPFHHFHHFGVGIRIVLTMAKVSWLQFSMTDARWAPKRAATAPEAPTKETFSWGEFIRKFTRLAPTTAPNVPVIQTMATLMEK